MARALIVKNTSLTYSNKFDIFPWFCVIDVFNFPFNLRDTKTIENTNV